MCRRVHISKKLVGYANKTCAANKFVQIALQFETVADGILKADEVLSGLEGVTMGDDYETFLTTASQIQIIKADGTPDKYYYLNDGWYEKSPDNWDTKAGWCDSTGVIADLATVSGQGFWLWVKGATDQVMQGAGQVPALSEIDATAPEGIFSINGGVFPVELNLNNPNQVVHKSIVGVTMGDDYETFLTTAPQIQFVKADGTPDKYYYLNDGWYEKSPDNWDTKAGWCDSTGVITDPIIPAQGAFWVWAKTGAITFTYKR